MERREEQKMWVYVIDDEFRVVYSNEEARDAAQRLREGKPCYLMICHEEGQCQKCPLREENRGKSILYDHLHETWVSASASTVDWPGAGKCHMVLCDSVDDNGQNFFYNAIGRSEYSELLELNYLKDTYHVIYHGSGANRKDIPCGSISGAVRRIAQRQIHPEDRDRFYDFWGCDRIGHTDVPAEWTALRHSEFRRLNESGRYEWVQQVLMPVRQSAEDTILVLSFYHVIDMPEEREAAAVAARFASRETFFKQAGRLLDQVENATEWCVVAIDIERFKLFNEWYGHDAGDRLLVAVSDCLDSFQDRQLGIAGHFSDDDFAFLMRCEEKGIQELCSAVSDEIKRHCGKMNVLPAFGVYPIKKADEPIYQMYDRAQLACGAVKGNYISRIKWFEPQMLEALGSELLLLADIQNAFEQEEFLFYLQPKCDMRSGRIVGAEALVRWNSAEKGLVAPGVFIPFLEKSGLITELDTYIWEAVCRWQRSMLDRGCETVPVSVNISRIDICSIDVPAYLVSLIEKYRLDPGLIELEITESAYAEDIGAINEIVERLREVGFRVLMDDFGSAYSSLNMLKDIAIDVIKMDMRFLDLKGANIDRGVDILETVCNMAHILGLGIIAEGVETAEQKDLLLKSGCTCGQGYYFYRPIPTEEFEAIIETPGILGQDLFCAEPTEMFYLKDLLNKNMLSENMLSNMLGAVAFYDVYDGQITVLRYNEQYAAVLGNPTSSAETSMIFGEQLYQEEHEKIFKAFDDAQRDRHSGTALDLRRRRPDGTDMWMHLQLFFLYQRDGHSVFYSSVTDVTEVHQSNQVLRFLNNDLPGGYYRHKNNEDGDFTHISQRFLDIFGFTREEIREEFDDKFVNMVHPDDREQVRYSMSVMGQSGGNYSQPCRMRSKNGYLGVLDQSRLVHFGGQEVFQGIILCDLDSYMWLNEDVNSVQAGSAADTLMPCGVFRAEADGEHRFDYISNSMLHLLGYSRQDFVEKFGNSTEQMIYREDRARIDAEIADQMQRSNFAACEYRVELADGSLKWVYSRARLTTDVNGKRWFYVCITDYDYLKEKYQIQEWQYLKYKSLIEIPGVLVYDFDPETGCLTVELTGENGKAETVVAENYIENMQTYGFITEEHMEEQKKNLLEAARRPVSKTTEFRGRFLPNQEFQWYRFHYVSLADENGKVYRLVGRGENITEEKHHYEDWRARATKDSLTGLLNYESAKERVAELMQQSRGGTLFLMDIDNFKEVNDTLGHLAGDRLLQELAEIMRTSFREEDIVARFGGDEFLAFVPGAFHRETMARRVEAFLERVARIQLSGTMRARCSVGITASDDASLPFDTLFERADTALYQSKRGGKDRYTFFDEIV